MILCESEWFLCFPVLRNKSRLLLRSSIFFLASPGVDDWGLWPHNNFERGQLRTSRHLGQERLSLGSQRFIPVHPPGVRWPSVALTIRIEHQSCFFSGVARIFFFAFCLQLPELWEQAPNCDYLLWLIDAAAGPGGHPLSF